MAPLKPNEVEYRRRGEKGSVRLQCPRDYDLFVPLFNDGFPVAEARKIVAERRREEKLTHKDLADCLREWPSDFTSDF
jgi:hypothetical protein